MPPPPPAPSNVAVYCASADGSDPLYKQVAEELGRALAAHRVGIIYGGARVGLMAAVADSALAAGGYVVGIIPEILVDLEVAHQGLSELHVTSSMHTRKEMMAQSADAFLVLPGGFGTLEELFEVLTWRTLRIHAKPILLLNTLSFYDSMLRFLDHCVAEGMLKQNNRDVILVAGTVQEALVKLGIA